MAEPVSPPRLSSDDRRRQLLEVAIDLFSKRGFAGTTTREIAQAAGVTEAIIFRHFATKQQLYSAIIDYRLHGDHDEWHAQVRACIEKKDDEGLFRTIITKIFSTYRDDPRFERVLLYAGLEKHELATEFLRQLGMPIFEMFAEYVAMRQREGALRACPPQGVILAVAGMAQHFAMHRFVHGYSIPGLSDEQALETFMTILMNGLRPPQGEAV